MYCVPLVEFDDHNKYIIWVYSVDAFTWIDAVGVCQSSNEQKAPQPNNLTQPVHFQLFLFPLNELKISGMTQVFFSDKINIENNVRKIANNGVAIYVNVHIQQIQFTCSNVTHLLLRPFINKWFRYDCVLVKRVHWRAAADNLNKFTVLELTN